MSKKSSPNQKQLAKNTKQTVNNNEVLQTFHGVCRIINDKYIEVENTSR